MAVDESERALAGNLEGRTYPVHHLDTTALAVDPDHTAAAVEEQVADGSMGGFVANAAATLAAWG